jgi:hypothetical protein
VLLVPVELSNGVRNTLCANLRGVFSDEKLLECLIDGLISF